MIFFQNKTDLIQLKHNNIFCYHFENHQQIDLQNESSNFPGQLNEEQSSDSNVSE